MKLILFFTIGFILDVLGIIDFKATQHNKAFLAAFVGFVGEIIGLMTFFFIIAWNLENPKQAIIEAVSYCLGGAVGAYLTIKYRKRNAKS